MTNKEEKMIILPYNRRQVLIFKAFTALLLFTFISSSNAAASQAGTAYKAAKKSYSQLKRSEKLKRSSKNWVKVIDQYEAFIERFPKDDTVDDAFFAIGELYTGVYKISKRNEDINSAIEAYTVLVKKFPKSPLADDALFRTGGIYSRYKRNKEAAYIEYDKILRKYPKGDMAAKAVAKVKELSIESEGGRLKKLQATAMARANKNYIHVNNIKHWSNPDYTRVVIYADDKARFQETFLKEREGDKPPRLFLDISGAKLNRDLMQPITINDGLLKMVRTGQFDLNTVRVVLDIESIDSYKIFAMEDPFRIIVDVSGEKKQKNIEDIISGNEKAISPEYRPSLAQQLGLGIKRVVIDPGHGGKDAGAIGYSGIREKDVVLEVGKKLRDILTERFGLEVIMTRDTDIFIELPERTAIANTVEADLFISLHCNASRNRKAGGVETYFLNFATDEDSMRLAAEENATSTKNISDLQAILNDLMLNSKVNESSKLARYIQDSILDTVNGNGERHKNRGVKQAPFYVLIGAQMPSILVEMSFITNKEEAERLADEVFQKTIAKAIAKGVEKYSEVIKVASYQ